MIPSVSSIDPSSTRYPGLDLGLCASKWPFSRTRGHEAYNRHMPFASSQSCDDIAKNRSTNFLSIGRKGLLLRAVLSPHDFDTDVSDDEGKLDFFAIDSHACRTP